MDQYLKNLLKEDSEFLQKLRAYGEAEFVPIVRLDMAALLRFLVKSHKPARILEAGTAIGYSSILMAQADESNSSHIDTIEIDPDTAMTARRNIAEAGLSSRIRVIVGDALEVFESLNGTYDMIFVDSAKSQYILMYDCIKKLLRQGGLLVCDNVIYYGKIFDSPEEAPHKHRTIIANLRAFLEKVMSDKDYAATLLETGDGVLLATLNNKP